MRVEEPIRVIRLERRVPVLEGEGHERGLPFDNGKYVVYAHELNGRGTATGRMVRVASFASTELALACRNRINEQNSAFQAQVETDARIAEGDPSEEMLRRQWPGQVAIQRGPFYVTASFIDSLGRYAGGGAVSWFENEAAAQHCADTLNRENRAHEAMVETDKDYSTAA